MSEVATVETQQAQPSPFGGDNWTETLPTPTTAVVENTTTEVVTTQATPASVAATTATVEEIVGNKEWLKREFEVEDPEVIKQQLKEYRTLKDTTPTPAEIKFENEQSKQVHELFRAGKIKEAIKIIETQDRLEGFVTGDVTKENAADIIKLGLQLNNNLLTKEDIDFQFNQEYVAPKEPVQKTTEEDDDFAERHQEWKDKVGMIEQKKIVAAKMAIPQLRQAKTQLVLPEIDKPAQQANEPTAEQIEQGKKIRENFLSKLESDYSKAEGFTTKVKDESVELPVSFKIPDEDKVAIKGRLQEGLDVNAYMDKRWFDETGNPKIEQIVTDLYQLENLDKILSGVANNSANERLKEYRKETSNVNVTGSTSQQTFQQNQNGNSQVSPFGKDAWSEKPPALIHN